MKKIYIALIYITFNQLSFSQIQTKSLSKLGYDIHVSNQQSTKPNRSRIQLKTIILDENFENVSNTGVNGDIPTGWTKSSQALGTTSDAGGNIAGTVTGYNGYYTGDVNDANTAGYWPVPANGSTYYAQCNDDYAGDFCCEERLITPSLDFSGQDSIILIFDVFHDKNYGSGDGIIEVSTDSGTTWTQLLTLTPDAAIWQTVFLSLDSYSDSSNVQISFFWNDGGDCTLGGDNWGTGLAIDNVTVAKILSDNIANNQIFAADIQNDYEYTIIPSTQVQPLSISMIATNIGANTKVVGFDYSLESSGNVVDNGMSSSTVSLNSLESDSVFHSSSFTPTTVGDYTLSVTATTQIDLDTSDNVKTKSFKISDSTWAKDFYETNGIDASIGQLSSQSGTGDLSIGHLFIPYNNGIMYSIEFGVGPQSYNNNTLFFVALYEYDPISEAFLQLSLEEYTTGPNDAGNLIDVPLLGSGPKNISAGTEYLVVAGHYGQAGTGTNYPRIACSGPGIEGDVLGFYDNTTLYSLLTPPSPIVRPKVSYDNTTVQEFMNDEVFIYPNPASNFINISTVSNERSKVTLSDMSGKIIYTDNFNSKIIINTENYSKGIYLIDIKNNLGTVSQKIAVQ
jgi:hypothetical protein